MKKQEWEEEEGEEAVERGTGGVEPRTFPSAASQHQSGGGGKEEEEEATIDVSSPSPPYVPE